MELRPLVSAWSGPIADKVYSHNQHGLYVRDRTIPVFTPSARRGEMQRRWAQTAFRWRGRITSAQRQAWNDYAARLVVQTTRTREQRLTGQQAFQRANYSRQEPQFGWVDDPPVVMYQPIWTTPFDVTQFGPGAILFTIDNTDAWANLTNSGLVIFLSQVRPASINFYKVPWRRAKIVRGITGIPPANSQITTDPFGAATGPRRWMRSLVFTGDGRVSSPRIRPFDDNA